MTVTWTADLEENNFSEFTSTTDADGDMTIAGGAALEGSYGINFLIDDANLMRVTKYITKQVTIRYGFRIDPNSLIMANGDIFCIHYYIQGGGAYETVAYLSLKYLTATGYQLTLLFHDDAGPIGGWGGADTANITDASHTVEIKIVRATDVDDSDGSYEWFIDGASQGALTGRDNFNRVGDYDCRWQFGMVQDRDTGTTGSFFMDDFRANDDGGSVFTTNTSLTVADATCAVTSDAPALKVNAALVVADATCAVTSDNATIQASGISLTIADATSATTSEEVVLGAHAVTKVNAATCAVSSDNADLTAHNYLEVADATCAATSEAPVLTSSSSIAADASVCAITCDNIGLSSYSTLAVDMSTCVVTIDAMALLIHAYIIAVADATCLTYSDGPMHVDPYTVWKRMSRSQLITFRNRAGLF